MKIIIMILFIVLTGCSTSGNIGVIKADKGLQATCGGGCADYKPDSSGCRKFNDGVAQSCAIYFDKLCERNPEQCNPNKK